MTKNLCYNYNFNCKILFYNKLQQLSMAMALENSKIISRSAKKLILISNNYLQL